MKKIFVFALSAFFLSLSACSNHVVDINTLDVSLKMAEPNIDISEITSEAQLLVVDGNDLPYDRKIDRKVNYNHGKWLFTDPIYLRDCRGYAYAYFPYDENFTLKKNISILSQKDVLYSAPTPFSKTLSKIELSLKHALSKIEVNVNGNKAESLVLNSPLQGEFDLKTETFSYNVFGTVSSIENESFLMVIPHRQDRSDLKIRLLGKEYVYTILNSEFQSGKSYQYDFIIDSEQHDHLILRQISVENWEEVQYQDYL